MSDDIILANDCEYVPDDGRYNGPAARYTGVPEIVKYETERDGDGTLSTVTVTVELPDRASSKSRFAASYQISDNGVARPSRVGDAYDQADAPRFPTYIEVLTAANTAVVRLDGVDAVKSLTSYLTELAERTPDEGWEVSR